MSKWRIDKLYFEKSIQKGYKLLKNSKIDEDEREHIKEEIIMFQKYLNNDFEYLEEVTDDNLEFNEQLKDQVLRKLRRRYKLLGNNLITYFQKLYDSHILTEKDNTHTYYLNMDMQKELTMKNYQINSPYLTSVLLKNKDKILFEKNNKLECSSYCYYSFINDSQIIVINTSDHCYTLNHELEHALENILGYNNCNYFQEVGSINFEMLFLDLVYNENGFICAGDYEERLFNMYWYLEELVKYFDLMEELASKNFNVSLNDFKKIVMNKIDLLDIEFFDYVLDEIIGEGKDVSMTYLFSYLQAIKIRKMHSLNQIDNFELIKPYLITNHYNFNNINDFKIYDDYLNDMAKRTRYK